MDKVIVHLEHKGEQTAFPLRKGLGLQALAKSTHLLEFDCRQADCGICICRVRSGAENLSPPTPPEADFLRAMRADPDERLACQCRVFGDVTLEVEDYSDVLPPPRS